MNRIKELREQAGLTAEQLGQQIGLSQSAISHYESERRTPGLSTCRLIVAALNKAGTSCTLDDCFPWEEVA